MVAHQEWWARLCAGHYLVVWSVPPNLIFLCFAGRRPAVDSNMLPSSILAAGGTPAAILLHHNRRLWCSIAPQLRCGVCGLWNAQLVVQDFVLVHKTASQDVVLRCSSPAGGTPAGLLLHSIANSNAPQRSCGALVWDLQVKAADLTRLGACT